MQPTVRRLEEEFKGKVEFIAVEMTAKDKASRDLIQKYKANATPLFLVLNAKDKLLFVRKDMQTFEALKNDLLQAMK